jgi:hypothetical protein
MTRRDLSFFLVDFDELTHLLILYTFSPTLELNTYFDVYNSKLAFGLYSPDIGSDYLPSLSIPDFVLILIRRSCARHATTAAFPATYLFGDLYREQKYK